MGKHDRLRGYLQEHRSDAWEASFAEVEAVRGFALPPSARAYAARWANQECGAQAGAWRDAGWRVDHVNLKRGRVRFARLDGSPPAIARSVRAWGAVSLDGAGSPLFPALPAAPGVYEITVGVAVYVGEAEELRTSMWVHRAVREALTAVGTVQLRAATEATQDGTPADLTQKATCVLVEQAWLLGHLRRGASVLNL